MRRSIKSIAAGRRERVIREALKQAGDDRLPTGEARKSPRYVGGQKATTNASGKALRHADRQATQRQCRAAGHNDEIVVTGSLRVQRASLRHLTLGEL